MQFCNYFALVEIDVWGSDPRAEQREQQLNWYVITQHSVYLAFISLKKK